MSSDAPGARTYVRTRRTHDLLRAAKHRRSRADAAITGRCAGQPTERLPLVLPLNCDEGHRLGVRYLLLKCSGAKGTRTPGLVHAMRIRSVDPRPAQSNGEPPTCNNTLRQSGAVWASLNTLAPKAGSRLPYRPCARPATGSEASKLSPAEYALWVDGGPLMVAPRRMA